MNDARTILIVEDDEAVARVFERSVNTAGYTAVVAMTAEAALRQLDERRVDVVVMDLRMPFVDGFGLLYRLRSREVHQHTPVIIVTGDTTLTDEQLQEIAGLAATVRYKPIDSRELLGEIARLLSREP